MPPRIKIEQTAAPLAEFGGITGFAHGLLFVVNWLQQRQVYDPLMNISITPELEKFVQQEVKTGLYQSASEVIRAALRRLKEDKERKPRFMVSSKSELEDKLMEGVAELDRGEGLPGEQVFAELKAHSAKRRRRHV